MKKNSLRKTQDSSLFSYSPLLKILFEKKMKKTDLVKEGIISTATLAKISSNKYVSLEIIEKLCKRFNVQPSNIFEFRNN